MPEGLKERPHTPAERADVAIGSRDCLRDLMALVAACPEAPAWSQEAWARFLAPDVEVVPRRVLFSGRIGGRLAGVLAASSVAETGELEAILVHPNSRRRGLGRQLVEAWLGWARQGGVEDVLLEVRVSNVDARRLYASLGFEEQGTRRAYYSRPIEDAVLMRCALADDAGSGNSRDRTKA